MESRLNYFNYEITGIYAFMHKVKCCLSCWTEVRVCSLWIRACQGQHCLLFNLLKTSILESDIFTTTYKIILLRISSNTFYVLECSSMKNLFQKAESIIIIWRISDCRFQVVLNLPLQIFLSGVVQCSTKKICMVTVFQSAIFRL